MCKVHLNEKLHEIKEELNSDAPHVVHYALLSEQFRPNELPA